MMFGLMRVRTHDAEMAKKDRSIADWRTAWQTERQNAQRAEEQALTLRFERDDMELSRDIAANERDALQARLDALTPARGQGGRFAKRGAVSNG